MSWGVVRRVTVQMRPKPDILNLHLIYLADAHISGNASQVNRHGFAILLKNISCGWFRFEPVNFFFVVPHDHLLCCQSTFTNTYTVCAIMQQYDHIQNVLANL